ncbi:MAG: hypothetical protein SGILL_008918 [Bacillariaceae sp.]
MPLEQSTDTSLGICETQDGSGTNIRAGEETTSQRLKRSSTETKSPPALKPDSVEPVSFKLFTWKDELDPSSCSAEEEAAKVVAEKNAYIEVVAEDEDQGRRAKRSRKNQNLTPYVLTAEHEEYRRLLDANEKWEKELTTMRGLSKAEAGLVSDIVMKYGQSEVFPKEDPEENTKLLQLARPGWEQFRSIMSCFQKHVLPTGWLHKKDPETGEWTVVKMGAH